jgi:PAS domain S-box-containing protein
LTTRKYIVKIGGVCLKIAFISPYEELKKLVDKTSREVEIDVDAFIGTFKDGASIAEKLEEEGYNIIISRGATFHNIKEVVNIPVINCDITSFDIIYALSDAVKYSKKIALIIHENVEFNKSVISKALGIDLIYKTSYKNFCEAKKLVEEAKKDGAEVIIGGITSKNYAENIGLKGILIKNSPETISFVLKKAVEMVEATKKEMIEKKRLSHILEFSHEGIIVTNEKGLVTFFNPSAEEIMKIKAEDIIGKRVDEYIPTTELYKVIKTGESQLGKIQKIKNTKILTNRIPILINEEVQGVVATFQDINKIQDYEFEIRKELSHKGLTSKYTFDNYVGKCKKTKELISKAKIYAESDSTILISGESGTGKEILAQSIHSYSRRNRNPFVAINCSAIAENLLESELFGYEEGSFTGAVKGGKMGVFELAHKGTIFLDEIGSMPINLQTSLLRTLQEKEVRRIGSDRIIKVDVRVIAATNNNLIEEVVNNRFRKDLYYRLNVLKLDTYPLRERKEDIKPLFQYFVSIHMNKTLSIDKKLEEQLKNYHWPGNVRELGNFVERVVLLNDTVDIHEIFNEFVREGEFKSLQLNNTNKDVLEINIGTLEDMEKQIINNLHREYRNKTMLAENLGISRTTLWKKMK